jgi:hypothetical protein
MRPAFLTKCGANVSRFRLVDCQFMAIQSCITPKMLRTALSTLPQTLYDTYDQMLRAIRPEYEDFARRVLAILCFSARPIEVCELIEALATSAENGTDGYDEEEKMSTADDILQMCPGMLTLIGPLDARYNIPASERRRGFKREDVTRRILRADRRTIALAHFSVREYLVSKRVFETFSKFGLCRDSVHTWMARLCLVYLIYVGHMYPHLPLSDPGDLRWHYGTFDFLDYALTSWPFHARKSDQKSSISACLDKFRQSRATALALFDMRTRLVDKYAGLLTSSSDLRPIESHMILIKWLAYHGQLTLLELALNSAQPFMQLEDQQILEIVRPGVAAQPRLDLEDRPGIVGDRSRQSGMESLSDTAIVQRPTRVQRFYVLKSISNIPLTAIGPEVPEPRTKSLQELDRGFNFLPIGATSLALRRGHWDVVYQLLDNGFTGSKDASDLVDLDPLQTAARDGQQRAVTLILGRPADFHAYATHQYPSVKHPFYLAVANGHSQTVAALLELHFGKMVWHDVHGLTALILAARRGHLDVVEVLLQSASRMPGRLDCINAATNYGMTAVMGAHQGGYVEVVKLLMKHGAGRQRLRTGPREPARSSLSQNPRVANSGAYALRAPWVDEDDLKAAFRGTVRRGL